MLLFLLNSPYADPQLALKIHKMMDRFTSAGVLGFLFGHFFTSRLLWCGLQGSDRSLRNNFASKRGLTCARSTL
jgi:hypothetical protein